MRTEPRPRWARAARWIVGLGVAALCCWLLARDLDWRGVAQALGDGEAAWVAAGVLAIVATFFVRTRRWQALLWRSRVEFRPAMAALLVGQVVNMTLPMRTGDVVRATWIGQAQSAGAAEALGSVAVEKVWDLLALLASGLVLLAWMPLPAWFARSTWGTALMLALGGGLLWAALRWRAPLFRPVGRLLARLPAGWDEALLPRLRGLADGLEAIRQPQVAAPAIVWTGLTWALGAAADWCVLAAFGIPSAVAALFLQVALMVAGKVPTPAQLGVFEGTCVVVLQGFFDVPFDRALAVGLVLHGVVMAPPLVAAALLAVWPTARCEVEDARA